MKNLDPQSAGADLLSTHLFRHAYSKMVGVLVRYFGLHQVEIAEDIVQDTLVEALEKWSKNSMPDSPQGWLMDVAKKKMINLLRRDQVLKKKVLPQLQLEEDLVDHIEFTDTVAADSTLRMIFSCCHPVLPMESQVAIALKSLCGLSVPEIASALLTTEANINKRLFRAKQKFRSGVIEFTVPSEAELPGRLDAVFVTLYLLFNEGYYSSHDETFIREDLCYEAIRLQRQVIAAFPDSQKANGLLSLMLLQFARFESRLGTEGEMVQLSFQNRELWDSALIAEGVTYLQKSTKGDEVNVYQLQAGIVAEHCVAASYESTNWVSIYKQYCMLTELDSNPVVKMNKAIARFYGDDKSEALKDLLDLIKEPLLAKNALYYATLGEFYGNLDDREKSLSYLTQALELSKSKQEKVLLQKRITNLRSH